jgi:DNA-binding Lrp family transcriptional regulator
MSESGSLTAEEQAILGVVSARFPVSWAPYCDIGEEIGQTEIAVLNAVLKLRMTDVITRIGATFAEGFEPADDIEHAVAGLINDIPSGEHPFDEIHEMLEMRGIDRTAEWVVERVNGWIDSGAITHFGAEPA